MQSVLSEVYSADKTQPQPLASSAIASILRKAVSRRVSSPLITNPTNPLNFLTCIPEKIYEMQTDAASEFDKASRADLAEKERKEAEFLQALLPPLLPESDIDRTLQEVFAEQGINPGEGDPRKTLGKMFKGFYAKIDRSSVDPDLVKRRADALLSSK